MIRIDAYGNITAIGKGSAIITITAFVADKVVSTTVTVTVVAPPVEASIIGASSATILSKAVEGYDSSVTFAIDVLNYSDDVAIEWTSSQPSTVIVTANADPRTATVSAPAGSCGGTATITVTVAGASEPINFNVAVYVPISTEADFYGINNNKVDGFESFSPVAGLPVSVFQDVKTQCRGIISGYYLLTNNIVLQNADPENTDANAEGVSYYKKAIIGRPSNWSNLGSAFTGIFDGNGYKISGAKFDIGGSYLGVFGVNHGLIRNLEVELLPWAWSEAFPNYTLRKYGGALVAFNVGLIDNCKVVTELNVDNGGGSACSAGLVYSNAFWASKITNCFVEVKATRC